MEDIKQFRQWGSRTPGHPETFETPGVEVTAGPLGAGISNAVGLASAEAHLAAKFNKPEATIVDHYTYVVMGDGCNQEGIASEACSLAGHLKLGKLIALYTTTTSRSTAAQTFPSPKTFLSATRPMAGMYNMSPMATPM